MALCAAARPVPGLVTPARLQLRDAELHGVVVPRLLRVCGHKVECNCYHSLDTNPDEF